MVREIHEDRLFWDEESIGPRFLVEVFPEELAAEELDGLQSTIDYRRDCPLE